MSCRKQPLVPLLLPVVQCYIIRSLSESWKLIVHDENPVGIGEQNKEVHRGVVKSAGLYLHGRPDEMKKKNITAITLEEAKKIKDRTRKDARPGPPLPDDF